MVADIRLLPGTATAGYDGEVWPTSPVMPLVCPLGHPRLVGGVFAPLIIPVALRNRLAMQGHIEPITLCLRRNP